ncbi:hypothetical protein Tco_1436738, partial [Tanacetum coccineum]
HHITWFLRDFKFCKLQRSQENRIHPPPLRLYNWYQSDYSWQVIQNSDYYFEVEDSETKLMKETPYELLKEDQKK